MLSGRRQAHAELLKATRSRAIGKDAGSPSREPLTLTVTGIPSTNRRQSSGVRHPVATAVQAIRVENARFQGKTNSTIM